MNGRTILVLKLRSMVADASDVEKYLSDDQIRQWQVERKVDDDPRVTRVGAFIRKTSLASVIIGTPGAGEPTNSLSSAAKTSLDQQFYDRRPEVVSCDAIHYTSPGFLSFAFFGGSRVVQNAFTAHTTSANRGGSRWHDDTFSFMSKNGACGPTSALGVAA